ncbi:hypothetical protein BT93_F0994 [Corymbia citriodora subsp. variegata]|nr:hypothetical protein BT93_F0994 [Corymbia citriodora subsp. variegata]
MDNEEAETNSRRRPATPPAGIADDLGSDLALAMSLQQEEEEQGAREDRDRMATLSTIESETEEEEEYDDDITSEEEEEVESSDGDGPGDIDMAEFDDIDPDELSYEELMELGEIIGEEERGLSLEQIGRCFKPYTFQSQSAAERKMGAIDRCVICQFEYEECEKLVILDSCDHFYHSECITQWLQVKKTCPICSAEVSAAIKSLA